MLTDCGLDGSELLLLLSSFQFVPEWRLSSKMLSAKSSNESQRSDVLCSSTSGFRTNVARREVLSCGSTAVNQLAALSVVDRRSELGLMPSAGLRALNSFRITAVSNCCSSDTMRVRLMPVFDLCR